MKNLLLYTDIGDDIDDTLALCHLLEYTQHRLLAIITTGGDTSKRKQEAQKICTMYQSDTPIFAGSQKNIDTWHTPDYIEKLSSIIQQHKDITVISIWPCTDLAYTYLHIPQAQDNIKQIVYQGNTIANSNMPDIINAHNFKCDPQAALRCAQNIAAPQQYVGKQEAYVNPLTEQDLQRFSTKDEVNDHIVQQAKIRYQRFKQLNPQKRQSIYGNSPWVLSFPYDRETVKKV